MQNKNIRHSVDRLRLWLLFATLFTLPMFMRLNNILLGAFLAISLIILIFFGNKSWESNKFLIYAWPVVLFFLLAAVSCFRSWDLDGFQNLERYWSLLLVPLVMVSQPQFYTGKRRALFLSLAYGCIVTLLICYGHVFWQMVNNNEPLYEIFQEKYVGGRFTTIADTHPAYLGLFLVTSIAFLLQDRKMSRTDKFFHIFFLMLGLLQLAGKTTILLLLILVIYLLVSINKYRWQVFALFGGILFTTTVFLNYGTQQMARELFSINAYTNENRLARWKVSYDIFRENPVFGVGYEEVRELRKILYRERGLPYGWQKDYNAHNQFLEYLSSNGAVGGFVYVTALMYLLLLALYRKDVLFIFIFACFVIANMTESMLVRIKGIEYFAIFASLFLCGISYNKPTGRPNRMDHTDFSEIGQGKS